MWGRGWKSSIGDRLVVMKFRRMPFQYGGEVEGNGNYERACPISSNICYVDFDHGMLRMTEVDKPRVYTIIYIYIYIYILFVLPPLTR